MLSSTGLSRAEQEKFAALYFAHSGEDGHHEALQALVMAAILLAMTLHVLQRRRQIGALRAFGAARRVVFAIVWLEAFVVIGLGLVLGYGLGFLASWLLAQRLAAANGIGLPVAFLAEDGWSAFALLALGALVATVPALLAYRHAPAEALRA